MIKRWLQYLAMVLIGLGLTGCGSLPHPAILLNGCIIPHELDFEASGPADIPETSPLPPRDALKIWAGDRHLLGGLASDYNALRAHIRKECQ